MTASRLSRERHPLPGFVLKALESRNLMEDYLARPDYQQNDYIAWITRAKQEETQLRRLAQMLEELEMGGVYMKMEHPPSHRVR